MEKLTKRFEMRCTPADFKRWEKRAKELGLPSVATLIRITMNDAAEKKKTFGLREQDGDDR